MNEEALSFFKIFLVFIYFSFGYIYYYFFSIQGIFCRSVFPPHRITPTLFNPGYLLSNCDEKTAAAMEAPAEASTIIFIRSATIRIADIISSLLIVMTSGSTRSQTMGKVSWPHCWVRIPDHENCSEDFFNWQTLSILPSAMVSTNCGGLLQSLCFAVRLGWRFFPLGSTAMTLHWGLIALVANAMPEVKPPPEMGTKMASRSEEKLI